MKKVAAAFLSLFLFISITAQTKRALVVAIGNYLKWPHISSLNDTSYILSTLKRQGFEEKNIQTLTDSGATISGITKALNNLINNSRTGDVVVIHFSSHGEQIQDDNGDELDGLDETIVTYDAIPPDRNGHFADFATAQLGYFRDDQFGALINQLRSKLGKSGDVIVFMDLCHSGTGTRGSEIVRGDKPPGVSATFDPKKFPHKDTADFNENASVRGNQNALATYMVFAAAEAGEVDTETFDEANNLHIGPLSYAISKVFEKLDSATTYSSLFEKVAAIMQQKVPKQHPVLEGSGSDRILFGGKFVRQKPYVDIAELHGKEIIVKAGLLFGLDTGATVSVYPSGTIDPAKGTSLADGKVINADNYTATVSLNKDPGINQPVLGRVFIKSQVYHIDPITLGIGPGTGQGITKGFSESKITMIREGLRDFPLIKFDGTPELSITKGPAMDSIKVASNGYLFATVNIGSNTDSLREELQRYAQYKFLLALQLEDPGIHVEVKLVPVFNGKIDTTRINTKIVKGTYEYRVGDTLGLLVSNKGHDLVYFNVLDMQPDGLIKSLLPKKEFGFSPEDLKIPGDSFRLFDYKILIGPPLGNEIFKIFVSRKKIDLEGIATNRGNVPRGNLSALEALVTDSYGTSMRGGSTLNGGDGKTYDLLFVIKP